MNFEKFIEQKAEPGTLDSSGQFTLLSAKAIDKTAAYAFSDSKHWILKMVQAAVAAKCDQFKVGIRRRGISVELSGGEAFSLKDFATHLAAPVQPSTDAASELFLGLKSLLTRESFLISDSLGLSFRWQQGELRQKESRKEQSLNLALWVPHGRFWSPGAAQSARDSLEYRQLLVTRALFAPLKLVVDGQELSPLTLPIKELRSKSPEERFLSPVHLLAAQVGSTKPSHFTARSATMEDSIFSREPFLGYQDLLKEQTLQFHLFLSHRRPDAAESLNKEKEPASRVPLHAPFLVHFGRLGVIGETRKLESCQCGGIAYYELGPRCGDLSGLRLSSTYEDWRAYRKSSEQVEPLLEELASQIAEHKPRLHYQIPTRMDRNDSAAAGSSIMAFVCPSLIFYGPKGLLFGAAAIAAGGTLGYVRPYFNLTKLTSADLAKWAQAVDTFRRRPNWKNRENFKTLVL